MLFASQQNDRHMSRYANLMTSGKLVAYLDDIEQQATAVFLRLVKELAEKEGVTKNSKLKAKCCGYRR